MISPEQIERFFKKQCTASEAQQVAGWLIAHPELVTQYMDAAEWHYSPGNEKLTGETYDELWQQIHKKIKKKNTLLLVKRFAFAACGIGCIAVSYFYFNSNSPVLAAASYSKAKVKVVMPADTEYNYTNKISQFRLEDGSLISLFPKAAVWFDTPFTKVKRDIYLKGDARFEVAKNKQRPFTVYAGAFATTALGTEFIVKQQNSHINVQLLHGKVVVKNIDVSVRNWHDVYLLPGQQMNFAAGDAIAKISFIQDKKSSTKAPLQNRTQKETADSILFNGSSIAAVLQKLGSYYNVHIAYTDADLKDISFTGVVAKKDSVENILKVLAQMNGLSMERNDSSFVISKTKISNTHL